MRLFKRAKDGGEHSRVSGFFLIEMKSLFSVALLHFDDGSREAYHTHAFNAVSWVLRGSLHEDFIDGKGHPLRPSLRPVFTSRDTFHKVTSQGDTWVLTFRGPWVNRWKEYLPPEDRFLTLTHGRCIVPETHG